MIICTGTITADATSLLNSLLTGRSSLHFPFLCLYFAILFMLAKNWIMIIYWIKWSNSQRDFYQPGKREILTLDLILYFDPKSQGNKSISFFTYILFTWLIFIGVSLSWPEFRSHNRPKGKVSSFPFVALQAYTNSSHPKKKIIFIT